MSDPATDRSAARGPDYEAVAASEPFQRLRRRHRGFVFPLAVLFLVWYFVYVLLAAYAHDFMATPVIGNVNLGLLLGLGQFVTTFVITMAYVRFANRRMDPEATAIRHELEEAEK
ncbi:hypothetical protein GCM10027515_15740 [Schumannella luteola]|uniref:Uncharacterized membrane protein (DUF485 family) n=1 Tax=Schumannella luteola TaxID=472059 RepID=A0A852YCC3_9MICO|nr:uncharacterized membrane protein (DUF485 family) [Schumannella luteola]TPX04916.1 DUF485 domain-containing protein [Schumannella luteola]